MNTLSGWMKRYIYQLFMNSIVVCIGYESSPRFDIFGGAESPSVLY